ncbi:MAG: ROK family transcriptional regulator [Candidatus Omnitrophica bacterium]|nr:ROK family transcriptional regulator [Candidatus Omnitrophota bacterium]MBI2495785.1 ROK family transcriptional regulator [Candidatus Omnitrophota bacterium]MBI3021948.1 ROK family transcriptional regulator [Candidatus Omnitrophota bacterium]
MRRRSLLDQHRLTEREEKNTQLLELLRQRGPLTRTELSQGTGFNIVTVSNYLNEFIRHGLVLERGFDISTGGRKPVLVELNAKAAFSVGIGVGPLDASEAQTVFIVTDLRGEIVHRVTKPQPTGNMDRILRGLGSQIREVLKTSPVEAKKIHGIGIGLPGIMDERAGTIRDRSREGTRTNYVAIRDQLEAELRLPVLMGSDSTLAGYGELRLGLDRPVKNLVYLYSDVGASLIVNGHIYWGSGGSAGELGVFVPSDEDYLTWIKSPSFVLSNVWDLGLAAQAKKLIQEGHATAIQGLAKDRLEGINLRTVLQAAQGGDQLARELVEHAAMQLGIRIAYLVNLLNPEVVIIGGGIEQAGSQLLEPVWRSVKKYAYEEPASLVDILPAQLGDNAVALGAACWVIQEIFIQA